MNKKHYKKYPAYKDSGIEWIGEIPEHWSIKRLKHITQCLDGKRIPLNADQRGKIQGEIPYWGANGILDYLNDYLFDEDLVLLGEDGAPFFDRNKSVSFFVTGKIWVNNHAHILRSIKGTESKFLCNALNCVDYRQYINGSTRDKLTQGEMNDIPIQFPPFIEQKAIANFLDCKTSLIDTLIDKKKRQIELLNEQRQAVINQAVTKGLDPDVEMKDSSVKWLGKIPKHWDVQRLRYIFTMNTGLSITKEDLQENGIPCINYGDIHIRYGFDLDLSRDILKYVDEKYLDSKQSALAIKNDFVFCDTSEDIEGSGNCVYISKVNSSQLFAGSHTIIAKPIIEVNSRYLAYLFMSPSWRTQIRSKVYGIKVYSITQKILKDAIAILPPLLEQQNIVDYLDEKTKEIDIGVKKAEKQIQLLQEYRTALISEAVTGKIDVRGKYEFS